MNLVTSSAITMSSREIAEFVEIEISSGSDQQ